MTVEIKTLTLIILALEPLVFLLASFILLRVRPGYLATLLGFAAAKFTVFLTQALFKWLLPAYYVALPYLYEALFAYLLAFLFLRPSAPMSALRLIAVLAITFLAHLWFLNIVPQYGSEFLRTYRYSVSI